MYGLQNSELSTCLFQFSHKTRPTMLLYAYFTFTPKVDFKRKVNHHQSFLYEWRLTAWTIWKFRIGPSIRIESRIGCTIRNWIESRSFAGPYYHHCLQLTPLHVRSTTTPLVSNSLQSGQLCVRLTASVHDNLWEMRSFCSVLYSLTASASSIARAVYQGSCMREYTTSEDSRKNFN